MLLLFLIAALPPSIGNTGLYALGWSADGRQIATMFYYEGQTISHTCVMVVQIQDLATDKTLWEDKSTWGENGEDGSDDCPKSEEAAWKRIEKRIWAELSKRKITKMKDAPPLETGAVTLADGSITFTAELKEKQQLVTAASPTLGKKILTTALGTTCDEEIALAGFIRTPNPDRVAVVVKANAGLDWCPMHVLVGCNTKSGFKR